MQSRIIAVGASLLVGWVIGLNQPASAANWPRFRGPNGTGIAADKDIPVEWNATNGILWKTAIPGVGNSSPIIWGDRLFLQSSSADGKQRMLLCLDVPSGKILWSRSVPGSTAVTNRRNTLASSTPVTDGERVYVLFWDGAALAMHAYDFEGNLAWKADLGPFISRPKEPNAHGAAHSPMVYKDKVFLNNDQDGSANLIALDSRTGKIVWQAERAPFRACYSTPFVLEKPGQTPELIVVSTAGITSYHPDTGAVNWMYKWTFDKESGLRTVGSPIFHPDGLILATSGDGAGDRHMIAVKPGGTGDISATNLAWESKRIFPYVPTMLAWGEHVYFVNDGGIAACHVAKTGENVWTERLGGAVSSSPVLVDGKIYAVTEDGDVHVFLAAPAFKRLAKNSLGEPAFASPAVADGRLFIRGKSHLFCISKGAAAR